jgi:hypothetical protein
LDACLHGPSCDYLIANGCASAATGRVVATAPTGLAALRGRDEQRDHDEWIRVSKFAIRRICILQKLNKQLAHLFRLLLLQPVTGSVYKVDAAHLRARGILHGLE